MAKTEKEPDIRELRHIQAEKGLDIAKAIDPHCFIGELNDNAFYLVTNLSDSEKIQNVLVGKEIEITVEVRDMSNDVVLHFVDKKNNDEDEQDE